MSKKSHNLLNTDLVTCYKTMLSKISNQDNKNHKENSSDQKLSMQGLIENLLDSPQFLEAKSKLNYQEELLMSKKSSNLLEKENHNFFMDVFSLIVKYCNSSDHKSFGSKFDRILEILFEDSYSESGSSSKH